MHSQTNGLSVRISLAPNLMETNWPVFTDKKYLLSRVDQTYNDIDRNSKLYQRSGGLV